METATILIVEDDAAIAQAMMQRLDSWGFQSVAVRDFKDVVGEFAKSRAHLVIMDVSLPYFDGFYWCRRIRELSKVPILFVSGDCDPVGEQGRGVIRAYKCFLKAGMKDVTMKLYHGGRHEMLNETNRAEVYEDVLSWLNSKAGK